MFAGPVGASSDRGASTMLRKEPLSLRLEREGRQGFPRLFVRPSCFLFARKEGWKMPCYPRWARAMAFPVSCYWVSPSGGSCPIRWGSASGPETHSKSTRGFL